MAQPTKKKTASEISGLNGLEALSAFKKKNNLIDIREKPQEWIQLSPAFFDAVKIPGIPKGYVSAVRGHSNTGKSTIKLELIAACQKQGILPVIFETENNFPWDHAKDVGMQFNDTVDEATGEITGRDGFFLYYDTAALYDQYGCWDHEHGKLMNSPTRATYVIEDIAMCIRDLVGQQNAGELPYDMCFIWDSVGCGDCYRSAVAKSSNNMWYAGALSNAFNTIVNDLIPSSRRENRPYTNTMFFVNKIWIETAANGLPSVKNKGGNSLFYAVRLMLHLGGTASASVKQLKATSQGQDYQYGTLTKVSVAKNQVNNITCEGQIACVSQGLWNPDKINDYKKEYASFIKEQLMMKYNISVDDNAVLEYTESDAEETE